MIPVVLNSACACDVMVLKSNDLFELPHDGGTIEPTTNSNSNSNSRTA